MKKQKMTIEDLAVDIKNLATKTDKRFDYLEVAINDLAISTKHGFDAVDFKFAIIDDRFKEVDKRFDRMENKFDLLRDDVAKTNDAFARLSNYVSCEIAAVRGHMMRVDEKIGLAGT